MHTSFSPVAFIDSGLGGISVLNECRKLLWHENFIYVAETEMAPFGNKNRRRITKILIDNCLKIKKLYEPKVIVLACNSITAASISKLRLYFKNTIFIGIEPAIKPAIESKLKNILVMCTVATQKYSPVIKKFCKCKRVRVVALKKLASLIDNNLTNFGAVQCYLNQKLCKLKNIEGVVLGCTHYSFIMPQIQNAFKNKLLFFNSITGVALRLLNLLKNKNLLNTKRQKGKTEILVTKDNNNEFKKLLIKYLTR